MARKHDFFKLLSVVAILAMTFASIQSVAALESLGDDMHGSVNYPGGGGAFASSNLAIDLPTAFGKIAPINLSSDLFLEATLAWQASDTSVASYEYCYDLIDNNTCDGTWLNNGLNTKIYLGPLKLNQWTTYYWQVRAVNGAGQTYADGGTWWGFSTDFRSVTPCDNLQWSCENIDQKPFYNDLGVNGNTILGLRNSMDLDSQGYPHIVYLQLDQAAGQKYVYLKYAFWNGARWNIQVLDNPSNWSATPSIKVDSQDKVHISYFKNSKLKYASWDGANWLISDVGSEIGSFLSMALDNNDQPHLVYCNGTDLRYAVGAEGVWNFQTLYSNASCAGDFGDETSLALDQNSYPHILYIRGLGNLVYAAWDGNQWNSQLITSLNYETARMVLDKLGTPHVVYGENTTGCVGLNYATLQNNSWAKTTLAQCTSNGYSVGGIAIDQYGHPHISFSQSYPGSSDLQYITWNGSAWMTVTLEMNVNAGSIFYAPIVVNDGGTATICHTYSEYLGNDQFTSLRCASNELASITTGWAIRSSISIARDRAAAASVNGKVYVIGGRSFTGVNTIEKSIEEYDPATNIWTSKALKPTAVSDTGAAVINNKIYVPGGFNFNGIVSVTEVYDPATDQWSSVAPIPVALSMPAVVALNNKLYAIGGSTTGAPLNTCYVYDPSSNQWSSCAPMSHVRMAAGAGVANNRIYVVGGLGGWGATNYVEEYDPSTNTWIEKAQLKTARSFAGVVGYGGYLYVCGGEYPLPIPQKSCEKFDPANNTWTAFDHLNVERSNLAMTEAGGRLYAVGGWKKDRSATNEESPFLPVACSTFNLVPGCATVNVKIGENQVGNYEIPSSGEITLMYAGVAGGPVVVRSTDGTDKIFASEHRNYQTSFSETLGYPDNQLTTKYWFTRYAYNANVKTWILVTNPSGSVADVKIYIGNLTTAYDSFSLPAGTAVTKFYDGIAGGPVVVESTNAVKIFASEHRNYQTSFSETLGFPNNQLTTKYWFTRYAYNANVKTWLLITNTDPNQSADVKIYIGDLTNAYDSFSLPAGTAVTRFYDGIANGPVVVESTNGVKIFASEHRNYQTSFSETLGFPNDQLTLNVNNKFWFTRYAYNSNVKTWILVTNTDPNQSADVSIYVGDLNTPVESFSLAAGTAVSKFYDGTANGPVVVRSTNGVQIFASEHRNYQTSFSESLGFPDNQLTTKYWFTRYAYNANVQTWILVANP